MAWADQDLVLAARDVAADIPAALSLAIDLSPLSSHLGTSTWSYLQSLGSLGAGDLTVARVVEPHLDALSILAQAADAHPGADGGDVTVSAPRGSTWGVYAAHSPDTHLDATRSDAGWRLSGSKPWCSLAAHVSHAIITAHVSAERRQAFAVDLSRADTGQERFQRCRQGIGLGARGGGAAHQHRVRFLARGHHRQRVSGAPVDAGCAPGSAHGYDGPTKTEQERCR